MKKWLKLFVGMATFLFITAGVSQANVLGSSHDLSLIIPETTNICTPCHAAHGAKDVPDMPLSSRSLPTGPYLLYSSRTLDATLEQPSGLDAFCLSCHDGTIALDSYKWYRGSTFIRHAKTRFDNSHPFGFDMAAVALVDPGIADPVDLDGSGVAPFKLVNGKIHCVTCHEPHNESGNFRFLRSSAKDMCTVCHTNK